MEEWKQIEGYPNYWVSNKGRVKSDKILNPVITPAGYERVGIYYNGNIKQCLVHRLVAQAFIPNEDNKPTVLHKDKNKLNNNVENLEWSNKHKRRTK